MILAATGHRPDKLVGLDHKNLGFLAEDTIKLHNSMQATPLVGISGMAQGWDTIWALALLRMRVPLIAAVPFAGQADRWPQKDKDTHTSILQQAKEVLVLSPGGPRSFKYHVRNRWMVNNCDKLIALWDGSPGGTASTIGYACKVKREFVNLWDLVK